MESKICQLCGKSYSQEKLTRKQFLAKTYCSASCANKCRSYKTSKYEIRHCPVCGAELPKYKHESVARYNNKIYCSTLHAREFMKKNGVGWWSTNRSNIGKLNEDAIREVINNDNKNYMEKYYGNKN